MEELKTSYKISLDFYIRKIITVNAKQLDSESRIINITCTENGKKFFVDSSTTSAFVRYKKSDGHAVLNEIDIMENGTLNLELTQQMLAVEGRHTVDIMLINGTDLSTETVEDILNSETVEGVSVLSTMSFYINTEGVVIDTAEIESSYEFNTLVDGLGKLSAIDQHMTNLAEDITENEANRQINEQDRITEEQNRVIAETERQTNTQKAINDCEIATLNANTATQNAQDATSNANTATENANIASELANEATDRANQAVDKCEKVIDGSGIILQSEKGIANGVATLDENIKIPNSQLNTQFEEQLRESILSGEPFDVILGKIYAYMKTIDRMSQISTDENKSVPILMASSDTLVEGDSYETHYNPGVTVNPFEKSINANSGNFTDRVVIGDVTMTYENDIEKRIVIAFN